MQSKLSSFFSVKIDYNEKHKKCFIYDPSQLRAYFTSKPEEGDTFIIKRSGINLYLRYSLKIMYEFPTFESCYIPLLKSNLQKAIRRGLVNIAVTTALALLQREPIELLRRLAIIFIEDVCLMDSYPIIVWLMIADKDYTLTSYDIDIVLRIIKSLCECKEYFSYDFDCKMVFTHDLLENIECHNELLALYYRSLYGGMKGDIEMLCCAIKYYINNPTKIIKTVFNVIDCPFELEILDEAIDYHPFPLMINMLCKKTTLDIKTIKELIWSVESGYNIRKSITKTASNLSRATDEWKLIETHLAGIRSTLVSTSV
jgi:hypothetical protein